MSSREPFKKRLAQSLQSEHIPIALRRGLTTLRDRRNALFAPGEFTEVQRRLGAMKAKAIDDLPALVERFIERAERVGTHVHRAATAADACRVIGDIARQRGVKLAVKSKSMATEEIELNGYLERLGIEVVETDLGEWIIQLAHDHPSHLIAPAIHLTREQIAELFSAVGGEPLPPETQALVRFARRALREKFLRADLGITGANIGIADTGTIVIVTNEGNADLVTTLPPVHVAVMGVEKIVPTLDDAAQILDVLARNAAGQRFSTYVNMITGPSRSGDIEMDLAVGVHGPLEHHIVLLDNGRWQAREDPDLRDALRCIRCGACANVCPPYAVVGGHAFGYIYTGPIGLVLTAIHHGLEAAGEPNTLCASCNACEQICPVAIPIARQIIEVRQRAVARHGLPLKKKAAIAAMSSRAAQTFGRVAQVPFVRDGHLHGLPLLGDQLSWRSLPALSPTPFRKRPMLAEPPPPRIAGSQAAGMRVAYFPACITDLFEPETGEAAVRVLRALGCAVSIPQGWTCCGLVAANAGDRAHATRLLKQTIAALEAEPEATIVSTSTSCVVMLVQDAPHLLRDEPEWRARAEVLAARVRDFTRFVNDVARLPAGALARTSGEEGDGQMTLSPVTYHDACQSANCLGLGAEARRVLREVCGLEVREMAESGVCCGFGGTFSLEHPQVARRILARKLEHIEATGAPVVVTDNPGCLLHIRGGLRAAGRSVQALHLAEVLAARLPRTDATSPAAAAAGNLRPE
jgi:L-lactate dehydrogenase complex protein LldF